VLFFFGFADFTLAMTLFPPVECFYDYRSR